MTNKEDKTSKVKSTEEKSTKVKSSKAKSTEGKSTEGKSTEEKNTEDKNTETQEEKHTQETSVIGIAYSALHSIVALYAIYLSFKCNNGINVGAFVLAICCPWLYVLYHHAVSGGCVVTGNKPNVPPV